MELKYINYSQNGALANIKLNRPDVLNSFNRDMALEFQSILDNIEKDKNIRAVYLSGEGRAFCAGQDLAEAISGEIPIKKIVIEHYNPIILKIRNLSKPVICAVNGVAAGAGANIALACDIVVASEKASFIQSFSAIGLIPDSGGTYFLPRILGFGKASALMMLGDKISAKDAEELGLIYKVFSAEEFESESIKIAERLSNMPTYGLALTKKALNKSMNNSLEEQLNLEAELQTLASSSYDYKEGVSAFLEKRKPIFKGE